MGLGCEWRHAWKWWAGNFGDFWKKQFVEIWTWARAVQLGATGCAVRWLGQLVEIGLWAGQFSWGVDCGRCRNSQHSKYCVSLSSCRKTKSQKKFYKRFVPELKKVISVSWIPCIWIFYISIYLCSCIMNMLQLQLGRISVLFFQRDNISRWLTICWLQPMLFLCICWHYFQLMRYCFQGMQNGQLILGVCHLM